MNTLQGEIGVPSGWSTGASGVVDRSPWGGDRVPRGSEGGAPGCRAGAGEVVNGAFRAGNRCPAGWRVDARRLAADARRVAGRSLGVRRRSLRGTAGMLGAADEGPEAADDQPQGCEADARSCGDGARLSEVVGAGVAMSTCRGYAAIANSSPPVPWRLDATRKATKKWKRVVAATPSSQEGIDGASPPLAPLCDGASQAPPATRASQLRR